MEVRVNCQCDQTYAFDVEPVNGAMPVPVNCPACGADGTGLANESIRQQLADAPPPTARTVAIVPPPPPAPPASLVPQVPAASSVGLRINRQAPAAPAPPPPPVPQAPTAPQRFNARPAQRQPKTETNSMVLGVVGALAGAAVGSGILFALSIALGIRFPLFGTITGALSGFGARILYRGTDSSLGAIAAVISVIATTGSLYLLLGPEGMMFSIISIIVSASMAWRIAS